MLDTNKLQHKSVHRAHNASGKTNPHTSIEPRNIRMPTVHYYALNLLIMLKYLKRKGNIF